MVRVYFYVQFKKNMAISKYYYSIQIEQQIYYYYRWERES